LSGDTEPDGKPEALLRELLENCKRYGRDNDFVVVDDSESAEVRNAHPTDVARAEREVRGRDSYAGFGRKSSIRPGNSCGGGVCRQTSSSSLCLT